jgi:hypothetical protein
MSTDAIVILKDDHKQIRKLFRDFQGVGENATASKGKLAARIIEELRALDIDGGLGVSSPMTCTFVGHRACFYAHYET